MDVLELVEGTEKDRASAVIYPKRIAQNKYWFCD